MAGLFRTDLRTDRHPCRYRTRPHQIMMGCGCFCDLCSELVVDKVSTEGETSSPHRSQED